MTLGNNDRQEPWHVTVERVGPLSKGKKFFAGYQTRAEAEAAAAAKNAEAGPVPSHLYAVRPRGVQG